MLAKRVCMDCAYYPGMLSPGDRELLARLLGRYNTGRLMKGWNRTSWVEMGYLGRNKGNGYKRETAMDLEKDTAARIIREFTVLCPKEKALVSPTEWSCFRWTACDAESAPKERVIDIQG